MTLPGPDLSFEDARTASGRPLALSTAFVVGETQFGPDTASAVRSMRDFERLLGARTVDTLPVYDWAQAHFEEGGSTIHVAALRGPAAVAATATLLDSTGAVALRARAAVKGADGDRYDVDIDASTGDQFVVHVLRDDAVLYSSGPLATSAAAAAWSIGRPVELVLDVGGLPQPTAQPVALAAGDDDFDGITVAQITAACERFGPELGPGTYVLPGRTSPAVQLAAAAVALPRNRLVKCDLPAVRDVVALRAHAALIRAEPQLGDVCDMLVPRLSAPGLTGTGARAVPASALRTGCEGRNDAAGISPNQPAAGRWGIARYLTAPTIEWSDAERELLNDAGINVTRYVVENGIQTLRLYGSRTAANPATDGVALRLGSARLRMAIADLARNHAERVTFAEVDSGGQALSEAKGLLEADVRLYEKSMFFLEVTVELVPGELPGEYLVEFAIEFQAAPDAERVRVVVSRSVTEV